MQNLFRVHDLQFDVVSAHLDAFVSRPSLGFPSEALQVLKWGFKVRASSMHPDFDQWEPTLTSEILFITEPGEVQSWLEVAPREVTWTDPITADNDPWASLYVFEHEVVTPGRVALSRRGDQLRLQLQGTCSVGWTEQYGSGLKLELDTLMSFRGVLCGRDDEAEARAALAPLMDERRLTFERDEYGVTKLRP